MPLTPANPIAIEHETFGKLTAPPVLLIMGLGGQLIHWDEAFCQLLAGLGRYVIRFDNRDVGLSTKLDELSAPDTRQSVRARLEGRSPAAPYTLDEMADDAVRLLDWLGIARAHVVGISMGGMIAQCMTIRHPTRVLSLTSIMADAGEPAVPKPEAMIAFEPPATERETYVTQVLKILRALYGPRFAVKAQRLEKGARQVALNAFNSGYPPRRVRASTGGYRRLRQPSGSVALCASPRAGDSRRCRSFDPALRGGRDSAGNSQCQAPHHPRHGPRATIGCMAGDSRGSRCAHPGNRLIRAKPTARPTMKVRVSRTANANAVRAAPRTFFR